MFKIDNNLGNMIKIFRKKANLTQPELASLLRVSFSTLRRWEAYGGQPRADELKRICEVLNCTETELKSQPTRVFPFIKFHTFYRQCKLIYACILSFR